MKWFHTLKACVLGAVLAAFATDMQAVPAYPGPIKVTQADGTTLTIRVYGDERFHYTTTSDGYNIVHRNGQYYYARLDGGSLVSTGVQAKDPTQRTAIDRAVLNSVTIGVPYAAMAAAQTRSSAEPTAFGASFNPLAESGVVPRQTRAMAAEEGEEFHSLVILVQFSDAAFTVPNPQQAFYRLLNEANYTDNNATGSARDYYMENSAGQFKPNFDVVGPFTLSGSQTSYTSQQARFIIESCNLAEAGGVDFSQYVDDGILRDVFIFFAGHNQAEAGGSYLWPARMFYSDPSYDFGTWGGGRLLAAAYTSELKGSGGATMTGIGTFCHEFGHIVGWPDFYDTDYAQNGTGFNLDIFSLMASGSYVNGGNTPPALSAFERYMVGWATPVEITEPGSYTLEPVYDGHSYRINTLNDGEYFILEYRNGALNRWDNFLQIGNNSTSHMTIGSGSGMLVYHVDQSNNRVYGSYRAKDLWALNANKVNSFGDHECMRILMASTIARENGVLRDFGKMFFPGTENVKDLTASASPYFVGWDGFSTGYELYNIQQNGTSNVTFDVEILASGQIRDLEITAGQFDIFVSFFTPFDDTYTITCTPEDGEPVSVESTTDRTIHFTDLKPGTKYTVSLTYEDDAEPFEVREITTDAIDPTKMPTLDVQSSYETDDVIVLRYRNISTDITSVKWYLDGERLNGTLISNPSAGVGRMLTAEIVTADGTEYLTKYINITE